MAIAKIIRTDKEMKDRLIDMNTPYSVIDNLFRFISRK